MIDVRSLEVGEIFTDSNNTPQKIIEKVMDSEGNVLSVTFTDQV